jgi:hypothetical protein
MLARWKAWRSQRRRRVRAVRLAVQRFRETRGLIPIGGHVLRLDPQTIIVRVMYVTTTYLRTVLGLLWRRLMGRFVS